MSLRNKTSWEKWEDHQPNVRDAKNTTRTRISLKEEIK